MVVTKIDPRIREDDRRTVNWKMKAAKYSLHLAWRNKEIGRLCCHSCAGRNPVVVTKIDPRIREDDRRTVNWKMKAAKYSLHLAWRNKEIGRLCCHSCAGRNPVVVTKIDPRIREDDRRTVNWKMKAAKYSLHLAWRNKEIGRLCCHSCAGRNPVVVTKIDPRIREDDRGTVNWKMKAAGQ